MTLEEIQNLKEELLSEENIRLKTLLKVSILNYIESYLDTIEPDTKIKFVVDENCGDPLEHFAELLEDKIDDEIMEIHDTCIDYEEPVNTIENI